MITNNFNIGDEVYEECSRGFGSGGRTKVTAEDIRYDEKTGEPYRIINCGGNTWFKDDGGWGLGMSAYYIYKI